MYNPDVSLLEALPSMAKIPSALLIQIEMAHGLGIQSEEVLCVANATFVLGLLDEDHICLLVPKLGLKQDMFAAKPLCVECDCPEAEVAALFPFCTQGSGRQAAAQGGRRRQSSSTPKQNHIE